MTGPEEDGYRAPPRIVIEELLKNYQSYTGQLTARHVDTNPEPSDSQQPTSKLCTGNYVDLKQNGMNTYLQSGNEEKD